MSIKTYRVRIEPSGHTFDVAGNETVLEAALRAGFTLPYSCRNGSCGTCKGKILEGEVDYGVYEAKALTQEERAAGKALFCQAVPRSDLVIEAKEIGLVKNIPIKLLPARVVAMVRRAHDVMVLSLKLPQTERFKFLAGQYIDILLKNGARRSFSLANPPQQDNTLELHVRHVPGGMFSGHVFAQMKEKDLLRFRGPLGIFFLRESERPAILVAGGTGFAPVKSIVEDAIARGDTRPLHVYWGARARRDLYLDDLPRRWVRDHPHIRYIPVLSEPSADDVWSGRTGWVHEAVLADHPDLSGCEVYASGPPPMVEAIRASFLARGLPEDRLYYDSFEFAHAV
ncbi:CDP-6-deoxy-delta-3,4-glucoseen reductase [Sulfurifustis variabilis]|uniref:CDP-6-deoxy-delta-3,4-glucoseen reductase n=1 Tax=Sulfurifustis variabilis TaxID=1675686 RepID=A0A1B4V0U5_9GAMM|nr:CDP-6-deoxy-delta-3,4-glucoseen reductase [Sulfurifustis variabilis]BAU47078.1 CDP-6-deoxy-delta-3,4-glucoseen reductase [Sulfurifustis variabilis]